jgi:15-cis-phytoene synthase
MSEARSIELTTAYAHCRTVAKREAKNFYYAFRVLPRRKSDAMCAVYAFMRKADDLADDESRSLDARRQAMAAWTAEWRDSRHTSSDDPIFIAVNDTQQRFAIPDELFDQLIAGTTLDLDPTPEGVLVHTLLDGGTVQVYESLAALQRYCYLVASVVGLVCIRIFGYTDPRAEQFAVDTGIAFQLTNILRDIKEDAERGRIYLPADMLQENGVKPERIIALSAGYAIRANEFALLRGLEQQAQTLYGSADQLIPLLEPDSRAAMRVLVEIYHRLLNIIAGNPAAVFRERISVPIETKLAILGRGLVESALARGKSS